jgi:Domain of unknown function (DUF4490)
MAVECTSLDKKCGTNPFYITSNQRGIGLPPMAELKREAIQLELRDRNTREKRIPQNHDLSFLFSRTSDSVGIGIPYSDSALSKVFRQRDSLMEAVTRKSLAADLVQENNDLPLKRQITPEEVQKILQSYNHKAKVQHPLYMTSSNDYGRKKPTPATFTSTRASKNQAFSSSFNEIMPRGNGLNTSLSRSKVHSSLDPRFL